MPKGQTSISHTAGIALVLGLALTPSPGWSDPVFSVLYAFPGNGHGASPYGNLAFGPNGSLLGTAVELSPQLGDVVYELMPSARPGSAWSEKVIRRFEATVFGAQPEGLRGASSTGDVFGVTYMGGSKNAGTVFRLGSPASGQTAWTFSKLYNFRGNADGDGPTDAPIVDASGDLIGTTQVGGGGGGPPGDGTIYFLASPNSASTVWTESIVHRFRGSPDGAIPGGPLLSVGPRTSYGVTLRGGTTGCFDGCGTVFELKKTVAGWAEEVIYQFMGGPDGAAPSGRLAVDKRGSLYGATSAGGITNSNGQQFGTVFRLDRPTAPGNPWQKTTLYSFKDIDDGTGLYSGVVLDRTGGVVGTTYEGGGVGKAGTLFRLTPGATGQEWTKTVLHAFDTTADDGALANSPPLMDRGGIFYGITFQGGSLGFGTVWELVP